MADRLSPEDARRAVLEPRAVVPWWLGRSLDREGSLFPGDVSVALLADILELGEPENWPRTGRPADPDPPFFQPHIIAPKDDGKRYRSFLPEDLKDEDEAGLRALATASKNPIVRARLYEVLWNRFAHHQDALAAVDARLASIPFHEAEDDWPGLVKNLGRLTTLVLRMNAKARQAELVEALDAAGQVLTKCSRPFAFPVLADMVGNTLLERKAGREAFTSERGQRWTAWLVEVAERYRSDAHHGHDALVVLQAWHGRWSEGTDVTRVRRRVVEQLADVAAADVSGAPFLLERSLQFALDYGLKDLGESMRIRLSSAIRDAIPHFKKTSGQFTVPPALIEPVERCLNDAPTLSLAIRQLASIPGLLEVDLDEVERHVREELSDSPMGALMPAAHYHPDGKVTYRSNDFEGNVERQIATRVGFQLVVVEALLRHFVGQAMPRFEDGTLLGSLAEWPHLAPARRTLLARASERFCKGDWVSAGFVVLTVYEAVLRDLLRAGGYSALKLDPGGTQMDEPLNSLLRAEATRRILGSGHCDLVMYVLADPGLGWNLRNEVAHGTVRPESLTATRVLLAWLLIVRLTSFVAVADGAAPPAPGKPDDSPNDEAVSGSSGGADPDPGPERVDEDAKEGRSRTIARARHLRGSAGDVRSRRRHSTPSSCRPRSPSTTPTAPPGSSACSTSPSSRVSTRTTLP